MLNPVFIPGGSTPDDEEARKVWETIAGWVQADFPDAAGKKVSFERCYSTVTDDQGAAAFHAGCDNKGPTVTVVKSVDGHVFGGANDGDWHGGGGTYSYQEASAETPDIYPGQHSFLFCVDCAGRPKTTFQIKLDTTVTSDTNPNSQGHMTKSYATYNSQTYGPTFGQGPDLRISGHSSPMHQSFDSRTLLGRTYLCPADGYNPGQTRPDPWSDGSLPDSCKNYLHGGDGSGTGINRRIAFTVADYEVFVLNFE